MPGRGATMSFGRRIFFQFYGLILLVCLSVSVVVFLSAKSRITREYLVRYNNLGSIMAKSFLHMESLGDQVSANALKALRELEAAQGMPSDAELDALAQSLGVTSFYVIDSNGRFLRSSDRPVEQQTHSFFDYCEGYRGLLTGASDIEQTPILPAYPVDRPSKFSMIPNASRTRILNVSYNLEFVGRILADVILEDEQILSAAIFAPTGFMLGEVESDGAVHRENRSQPFDPWLGSRLGSDLAEFRFKIPTDVTKCCECVTKGVQIEGDDYYYTLRLRVSPAVLLRDIREIRKFIVGLAVSAAVIAAALAYLIAKRLVAGLTGIECAATAIIASGSLRERVSLPHTKDEVYRLGETFNTMMGSLEDAVGQAVEAERLEAIERTAAQVAHDIRSPLAAVKMALSDLGSLSEEVRCLIRSAVFRIEDIANQLLARRKGVNAVENVEAHLAADLVETLVSEKRVEYRSRLHLLIETEVCPSAYGVFVKVEANGFKSVLSNLINNGVDAVNAETGRIVVRLEAIGLAVVVTIRDNGGGMPPHVLERLGQVAISHGKEGGNGIGALSACQTLSRWGGALNFTSEVGKGTTAIARLPIAGRPSWFLSELVVGEGATVVVVDDDLSIHHIWTERLARHEDLKLVHLSRPEELDEWFVRGGRAVNTLFLVDYEFIGHARTGLDLIAEHGIAATAFLVTSRVQDEGVVARSVQLNVRIVPKSAAPALPIRRRLAKALSPDLVLIDDDALIRTAWELGAASRQKRIYTFSSFAEFLASADDLNSITPIYVDFHLGSGTTGDEVARQLFERGFKSVYIATGEPSDRIERPEWVIGVVGKGCPF